MTDLKAEDIIDEALQAQMAAAFSRKGVCVGRRIIRYHRGASRC